MANLRSITVSHADSLSIVSTETLNPMPASPINRPDPGNMGFLRALLAAIIFMILSAAILVSGFLAWHYPQLAGGSNVKPITLSGNELYIAIGKGEKQDSKLIVNELMEDGTAVISSRRTRFNASNYPILEYKITGRNPGTDVVLYWRTITHNQQTLFAKLHWNSDYKSAYNLQNHPEWKGAITELGISITGRLRNEPISIEQLTFRPLTVRSLLLTVWSEWNAFQGWSQSSINVVKGMPANAFISPVVTAASWCGLGVLLYTLWTFFFYTARANPWSREIPTKNKTPHSREAAPELDRPATYLSAFKYTWDIRAAVAMFIIAWLALDAKFQINLWWQLADTKYLFAGKTHHTQHMVTDDAELYAYARRIIKEILPKKPVRIFILQNKWRDRTRLKLMYYLLPHNIYNYGAYPNPDVLKKGDYILAINPIKGLSYSAIDNLLYYTKSKAIKADLLDQTTLGALYKSAHQDSL